MTSRSAGETKPLNSLPQPILGWAKARSTHRCCVRFDGCMNRCILREIELPIGVHAAFSGARHGLVPPQVAASTPTSIGLGAVVTAVDSAAVPGGGDGLRAAVGKIGEQLEKSGVGPARRMPARALPPPRSLTT